MTEDCRAWRGELAARALGRADGEVDAAFDAHLDRCAACQAELDELRATAAAATLADADRLHVPPAAPALADQIVTRMAAEVAASRRRQRGRLAVGAAAAAVVAIVAVSALARRDDGGGRPVELVGPVGVEGVGGSAVLDAQPWGTEVTLEVDGLREGHVYWLWLTDASGERMGAGTLTGTGESTSAVLAAALPLDETRRIWLTDERDFVVLDAVLEPG